MVTYLIYQEVIYYLEHPVRTNDKQGMLGKRLQVKQDSHKVDRQTLS